MKLLPLTLLALTFVGCARFTTTQTDVSPERTVTTKATAWTFGTSKSALANFKASQTDKTQGASVGGLHQESNGSNLTAIVEKVAEGAAKGAAKALLPTP